MLAGGAGIGKTRLLQEIQRNALGLGFTCLQGRCRGDDPDPLVAIKELISQMPGLTDLRSRLTGPELGWNAVRERLVHELLTLARSSPVLVALEDLQWADTSTLNLVHTLGRRAMGSNLLIVGTYRNEEVERKMNGEGSPLLDVTKALGKQGALVEMFLDELVDEDIKELVVRFLGSECDEEVHGAIIERSMGNPLFALENLKLMRETEAIYEQGSHWHLDETRDMPSAPSMHAVVRSRLEQLPLEERMDLQVLSVLGQSFSLPLASDLLTRCSSANGPAGGRSPTDLAMVWCDGSMMGFEHEEVRRAIYHSMPAERRRSVHHLTAVTLEGEGGTEVGHSILSYHFFNGNDWKESMDHSMEAGREAWAQQANREAAGYFERALRSAENLGPEEREEHLLEIMESLGDLYWSFCRFEACISCYEEARAIASDNETRARMLRKMSIPWASIGGLHRPQPTHPTFGPSLATGGGERSGAE